MTSDRRLVNPPSLKTVKLIAVLTAVTSIPLLLQVWLVSAGAALSFSLFWRALECFCNTGLRGSRLRYDDLDLAILGTVQQDLSLRMELSGPVRRCNRRGHFCGGAK